MQIIELIIKTKHHPCELIIKLFLGFFPNLIEIFYSLFIEKIEKFILINRYISRTKVFEPFEHITKPSPSIDAMMVSYGCVYKRSSKPDMRGSIGETVKDARKEYKKLLDEGWKKTYIFKSYF